MKRKYQSDDEAPALVEGLVIDSDASFQKLGLDARLLQGIAKLNFLYPTLVQAKAIPLALEGKDILGINFFGPKHTPLC